VIISTNLGSLIGNVAKAMWGLNAAMAANPIGVLTGLVVAFLLVQATLYDKLTSGRPAWEKYFAAFLPGIGVLLTVKNHLRDIAEFLGIIDKKKAVANGPWPSLRRILAGSVEVDRSSGGVLRSGLVHLDRRNHFRSVVQQQPAARPGRVVPGVGVCADGYHAEPFCSMHSHQRAVRSRPPCRRSGPNVSGLGQCGP
jgi:hypothetical protein